MNGAGRLRPGRVTSFACRPGWGGRRGVEADAAPGTRTRRLRPVPRYGRRSGAAARSSEPTGRGSDARSVLHQRARLGPRRRPQPVGCVRLRSARDRLRAHPRPLLPRHRACESTDRPRPGAARGRPQVRRDQVRGALPRARRDGEDLPASRRVVRVRAWAAPEGGSREGQAAARGAAALPSGKRSARVRRPCLPRPDPGQRRQRSAAGREQRRPRAVPLRRRPARGAERLAGRGAEGAGRGRAVVRTRRSQDRRVRSLRRHAQPGVRRNRGGEAHHERRRRPDGRAGVDVRREGRDDVLLLDLGRTHGERPGRLARRRPDAVPGVGRRPLRRRVAAPHVGAAPVHRGQAQKTFRVLAASSTHASRSTPRNA